MKLIIINSIFNLMLSVQLKKTILKEDKVEIILTDLTPSFKNIYEKKVLEKEFEKVHYVRQSQYMFSKRKFFDPYYALKTLLESSPKKYSDIYFWNNDFTFYNFYKWYYVSRHICNYHLYGDAMSAYILDSPDGHKNIGMYRGKKAFILNYLDKLFFKYSKVANMDYDYYIFHKEMYIGNTNRNLVNIPPINQRDVEIVELYNTLFDYRGYEITQKYIYLDTARDGFITDEDVLKILSTIIKCVGRENLIVKPHPRVDYDIYLDLGVELFDKDIPWEIYCLNNKIEDKIIICSLTSAAIMPYVLYGAVSKIVCVCDMIPNSHPNLIALKKIYKVINSLENSITFISNENELEEVFGG